MESDVKYPIYHKGTVVYSDHPRDFICYICPEKQSGSLAAHLRNENHLQRLELYMDFFCNDGPLVYCRLCPKPMDFSNIIDHAMSHQLTPWHVPEKCPEILFKNYISQRDHQYFCHLCNVKLPFWFLVEYHNKESHHQDLKRGIVDEIILKALSFSIAYYKLATNNSIFMKNPKILSCSLCACDVGTSYEGIITHIEGKCHIKKEKDHIEALKSAEIYRLPLELYPGSENSEDLLDQVEAESSDTSEDDDIEQMFVSTCNICHSSINSKDIEAHFLMHKNEKKKRKRNGEKSSDLNVSIGNLQLNTESKNFTEDIRLENLDKDVILRDNDYTNDNQSTVDAVVEGVQESSDCSMAKEHIKLTVSTASVPPLQENIEKSRENLFSEGNKLDLMDQLIECRDASYDQELPVGILATKESNFFTCTICHVKITGYCNVLEHSKGRKHLEKQRNSFSIIHVSNEMYECSLCQCNITGWIYVKQHVNGTRHRKALQLQERKSNPIDSNAGNPTGISIKIPDVKSNSTYSKGTNPEQSIDSSLPLSSASAEKFELPKEIINNDIPKEEHIDSLPRGIIHMHGDAYTCIICNCNIHELNFVDGHVQGFRHQRNVQQLGTERSISVNTNGSSECSSNYSTSASQPSLGTSEESKKISNTNSKVEEQQNLPAVIQFDGKCYICSVCKCRISCLISVKQHMKGQRHKTNVRLSQGTPKMEALPDGIIHLKDNSYTCLACKCDLSDLQAVREHTHRENRSRHRQALVKLVKLASSCTSLPTFSKYQVPKENEKYLPEGIMQVYDNLFICFACKCRLPRLKLLREHVQTPQHESNVLLLDEKTSDNEILGKQENYGLPKGIIHLYGLSYACLLCKCELSGKCSVTQHIGGSRHKSTIHSKHSAHNMHSSLPSLATSAEKLSVNIGDDKRKLRERIAKKNDKYGMTKLSPSISQSSLNSQESKGKSGQTYVGITEIAGTDFILCEICANRKFTTQHGIIGHLKGKSHRINLEKKLTNLPEGIMSTELNNLFWCKICETTMKGFNTVSAHAKSEEHQSHNQAGNSFMAGNNDNDHEKRNSSNKQLEKRKGTLKINKTLEEKLIGELPKGITHVRDHLYRCLLCNCDISGVKVISQHLTGQQHKEQALLYRSREKLTSVSSNGTTSEQSDYYSLPTSPLSSEKSVSHEKIMNPSDKTAEKEKIDNLSVGIIHVADELYKCSNYHQTKVSCLTDEKADMCSSDNSAKAELSESITHLPKGIIHILNETYECSLCKYSITGLNSVENHTRGLYHQGKVVPLLEEQLNPMSTNVIYLEQSAVPLSASSVESILHKNKIDQSQQPEFPVLGEEVFFTECEICYQEIFGCLQDVTQHTNSQKHRETREALINSSDMHNFQGIIDPQFDNTNDTKYFIIENIEKYNENIFPVMKVPKGTLKNEGKLFYWCDICEIKVPNDKTPYEHLKSALHVENVREKFEKNKSSGSPTSNINSEENNETEEAFPGIFKGLNGTVCVICDNRKLPNNNDVLEHVKGWTHRYQLSKLSWDQLNALSLDEILPEGLEATPGGRFFLCTICNCRVRSNYIDDHIATTAHLANGKKVISRISAIDFRCEICSCNLNGYKNVMKHLRDENHRINSARKALNESSVKLEDKIENEDYYSADENTVSPLMNTDSIIYAMTDESRDEEPQFINSLEFFSKSYEQPEETDEQSIQINKNIGLTSESCESSLTLENLPLNNNNANNARDKLPEGIEEVFTNRGHSKLLCTICNCMLPPSIPVDEHVATIDHRTNGTKVIVRVSKNEFHCIICNCTVYRYLMVMKHLRDKNHLNNRALAMPSGNSAGLENLYALPEEIVRLENDTSFWCKLCLGNVGGTLAHATLHVSTGKHQQQLKVREKKLNNDSSTTDKNIELHSKSIEISPQDLPAGIERIPGRKFLLCTICNVRIREPTPPSSFSSITDNHVLCIDHQSNGPKVISRVTERLFHCDICNCTLDGYLEVIAHLRDENHNKNKIQKLSNDLNSAAQFPKELIKLEDDEMYWCTLCFVEELLEDANAHVSGENHRCQLEQLQKNELKKNPTKVSGTSSSPELVERNTTAQRLISTFHLDNEEDPMPLPASIEPEDYRKILPQSIRNVPCEICNCMIPGGNWNVNIHRKSKDHLENEAKVNAALKRSDEKEDRIINSLPTPEESSLSDIPPEKMLEYHYRDDIIDYIECKVCDLKIRESLHTPATLEYLSHTMSQEHKMNEIIFINSWKLSMTNSYAARASAPPNKTTDKKDGQLFKKPGQKKIPCLMCREKFEFQKDLHSHMTKHFWKQFLTIPLMNIKEEFTEEVAEENREENKEVSEILETKPIESSENEDLEFDVKKSTDSPDTVESHRHYRKEPLDIASEKEINIYEIDKQRREDIELGVLLSFTIDKDNIYCLVCRKSIKNSLQNCYEHLSSVDHLDYLQEMIEDHKKFRDYPEQFSDLTLAHEYMQEISEYDVQCYACGISITNDPRKLNHHINNPSHAEKWSSLGSNAKEIFNAIQSRMESNFYSARKYWCVPCMGNWTVEIEFRKHLNKKKHAKKVSQFETEMLIFDYCAICATLWYGFLRTFSYHSTCKMHKVQAIQNYYLVNKLPQFAERLLYAAEGKVEEILTKVETRRLENKKKEDQLIRDLEKISKESYPSIKAYPFGSRISGLGGRNSDLDIFLDCSTKKCRVYSGENSSHEQVLVRLQKITNCLEKDVVNWYIDRNIVDCRIPIIKAIHRSTGIECDISFTNGLTVENTKIMNAYCTNYPECRKLIIFVKNWMGHCELTGLNGVNSYGIAWLVIYFLQVASILPTIAELINRGDKSRIIAGWETGVDIDFQPRTTDKSFRELLTQFFKFYATFDYRNNVICPLLGEPVKKTDFNRPSQLPPAMKTYLNYLNRVDDPEPFRVDSIMCLQDPYDLAHNISKAVKKFLVYRFMTFCTLSAQILDNNA